MFTKKIEVTKLEACALNLIQWFFQEMTIQKNSDFEKNERLSFSQINLKIDDDPNHSLDELPSNKSYKYKRVRVKAQFILPEERIRHKKPKKDYSDWLTAEILFIRDSESATETDWSLLGVSVEFHFVYHGGLERFHIENFFRSRNRNEVDTIGKREELIAFSEYLLS
ncbi:MAG: hypothetical protein KBB86_00750 [Candidatus Pacebacteria bacterium]|nr:hypothetical protein [Candidatus Paceibacterota bacterium]